MNIKFLTIILLLFYSIIIQGQIIISNNTTWSGTQFISQRIIVTQGAKLTIEPSTIIEIGYVDSNGDNIGDVEIEVNGKIIIKGNSSCSPVIFRPFTSSTNRKHWKGLKINSNVNNDSIIGAELYNAEMPFNILSNTTIRDCKINLFDNIGVNFTPSSSSVQLILQAVRLKLGKTAIYQSNTTSNLKADWVMVDSCTNGVIGNTGIFELNSSLIQNSTRLGVSFKNGSMNLFNSKIKRNYAFGVFNSSGNLTINNCDIDTNYLGGVLIAGVGINNIFNSNIRYNKGSQVEITAFGFNINSESSYSSFGDGFPTINANYNNIIGDTLSTVLDTIGLFDMPSSANDQCWSSLGPLFGSCSTYFTNNCLTNGNSGNSSPLIYQTVLGRLAKLWVAYGASLSSNANTRCFGLNVRDENSNINLGGTGACAGPGQFLGICINDPSQGGVFNVTPTYEQDKYLYVSSSGSSGGNFLVTSSSNKAFYLFGGDLLFNNIRPSIYYNSPNFNFQNNNFAQPVLTNYFFDQTNQGFNYQGYTIYTLNSSGVTIASNLISSNEFPAAYLRTNTGGDTICNGSNFYLIAPDLVNTQYNWYLNGNLFAVSSLNNYTPPVSGVWHCVVVSTNCTFSTTARNITLGIIPQLNLVGNQSICLGQSTNLTVSGAFNYIWDNGTTGNTRNVTPSSTSNYNVTGYSGGCSATLSFQITVNSLPNVTISPYPSVIICQGSSIQLNSSLGTNYLWNNGSTSQSINVSTAGVYSVIVTDANSCSASSLNTTVVLVPTPTSTVTLSGPTTFCSGGSVVLTSSASIGNLWSNGATTQSITVNNSGTYNVTVTNGSCSSVSTGTVVTVNSSPAIPVISLSGPTTFCSGGSVVLTSSNLTGNLWSNGSTSRSITVLNSGTYYVSVTNGSCTSVSNGTIITVNVVPPAPTVTASGPTTFCSGDSVTLTSSSLTGNLWSNGSTSHSITVYNSGNYSVTVSNGNCSSAPSNTTVVTVNPSPTIPTILVNGPTTFCSGDSVILTSSYTLGNLWSNGSTNKSITVFSSGTYTVAVSGGSCTSISVGIIVTVNNRPAIPIITANGPTTFCNGGSVELSTSNATSYLWSNGSTTQSIIVTNAGTYNVTISNGNCFSSSIGNIILVNSIPAIPIITANGPTTFCNGGSVELSTSNATSYLWSNGSTTQSIIVTNTGTYNVTISNGNCFSSSTGKLVTVIPVPNTPIITANGPTTFCTGGSVVLTSSSPTGNLWSNGSTTQSITVNNTGIYSLSLSSGGCLSSSSNLSVTVLALPSTPVITASRSTSLCTGDSVILTSSNASSYLWSNGSTTQSITVYNSGVFLVTTSNGLCSASSIGTSVILNSFPPIPTITANGSTTFCTGDSVTIISSSSTGNLWSNGLTTQSIIVNNSGTYLVSVSNGSCVSSSTGIVVTVNPRPLAPIITTSGSTTFCAGDSVTLTSSSSTGNFWSNGITTQSIIVNNSGTYLVSVSNGSCVSSSTGVLVTVIPRPLAPVITASGSTTFCTGDSITLTSSSLIGNLWSNGITTQSITVNNSGSYSVVNSNGFCQETSQVIIVNVLTIPVVNASSSGNNCLGATLYLNSSGGTSYYWVGPNGFSSNLQNPTISNVNNLMNGVYTVSVTNLNGCSTSDTITVILNSIQFITQPNNLSITNNSAAQFSVQSSDPFATYQWQTDLGFGFVNLSNAGQYSGANNDTLIVSNVTQINNNQQFRCIVSSGACSDTSSIALLSICATLSTQPVNQTAVNGDNISFVTGSSNPSATYQWQTDLGFGFVNLSNAGQYSGATNDTLTVSNVSISNNNQQFRCIVSAGACIDTSDVAVLTVNNTTNVDQLNNSSIKIYPNPASTFLMIENADFDKTSESNVRISNMLGQILYNQNINQQLFQIDLTEWTGKGLYLVEIVDHDGKQLFIQKVVID